MELTDRKTFDLAEYMRHTDITYHSNIGEQLAKIPGLFAFYSYQKVLWESALNDLEDQLEVSAAKARADLKDANPKMTVDDLKSAVHLDPHVIKLKNAIRTVSEQLDAYKTATKLFEMKGGLLQSVGASKRQEMSGINVGGAITGDYDKYIYGSPAVSSPSWVTPPTAYGSVAGSKEALKKLLTENIAKANAEAQARTGVDSQEFAKNSEL